MPIGGESMAGHRRAWDTPTVQPPSKATFAIRSSTHTSQVITDRLDLAPTRVHDRGDPVSRRAPRTKHREESAWFLQSAIPETQPLAGHLASLLNQIEPRLSLLTVLLDEGCQLDWFCYMEAKPLGNMVHLDAALLARLAALGGPITFDIYDGDPTD